MDSMKTGPALLPMDGKLSSGYVAGITERNHGTSSIALLKSIQKHVVRKFNQAALKLHEKAIFMLLITGMFFPATVTSQFFYFIIMDENGIFKNKENRNKPDH